LQGFPADFCTDLGIAEPTEADLAFWAAVWETHRKIMGKSKKPKTRNQLLKWLKNPHTDGAEYRLWGNGIALPCAVFVLGGIAEQASK
jgi:DNA (cytosine-5)-methyltransferase 1